MVWGYGKQAQIAAVAGVTAQHVNNVLHRRARVSFKTALALERASAVVFSTPIPWQDWICNQSTKHPAFFGTAESAALDNGKGI